MTSIEFISRSDNPFTFNSNVVSVQGDGEAPFARFAFDLWVEKAKIEMRSGLVQTYDARSKTSRELIISQGQGSQIVAKLNHAFAWRGSCNVEVDDVKYLIKRTSLMLGHTIYRVDANDANSMVKVGSFSRIGLYSWKFHIAYRRGNVRPDEHRSHLRNALDQPPRLHFRGSRRYYNRCYFRCLVFHLSSPDCQQSSSWLILHHSVDTDKEGGLDKPLSLWEYSIQTANYTKDSN